MTLGAKKKMFKRKLFQKEILSLFFPAPGEKMENFDSKLETLK